MLISGSSADSFGCANNCVGGFYNRHKAYFGFWVKSMNRHGFLHCGTLIAQCFAHRLKMPAPKKSEAHLTRAGKRDLN
ncbi:hypothetical protein, partial [Zoogloea sp.]|uniref:hypothetical protein n=1 Tax=Zoogloea sp. TaxID=49181 RepID=UPI003220002D